MTPQYSSIQGFGCPSSVNICQLVIHLCGYIGSCYRYTLWWSSHRTQWHFLQASRYASRRTASQLYQPICHSPWTHTTRMSVPARGNRSILLCVYTYTWAVGEYVGAWNPGAGISRNNTYVCHMYLLVRLFASSLNLVKINHHTKFEALPIRQS